MEIARFSTIPQVVDRFRCASDNLAKIMEQLMALKPEEASKSSLLGDAMLLILELKTSSRTTNIQVDNFRQCVQDFKKKLDASHQQLQNLLYRKQHLVRELTLCHDFTVREVERVEEDEGYKIITDCEDLASKEPHQKRLKVLTTEKEERSKLEDELKELRTSRQQLEESIDESKTFLVGLPEQLRSIQGASQVLQNHFKLPDSEKKEQHAKAGELSQPLYVLFRQLDSLCNSENKMKVCVVDSTPVLTERKSLNGSSQKDSNKKGSKKRVEDNDEDQNIRGFEVDDHAVVLVMEVRVDEVSVPVQLRFQRLVQHNTVVVESENTLAIETFANLFPSDTGSSFPSTSHFSSQAGTEMAYPKKSPCRPFLWAQWLAGLNSLPENNQSHKLASSSRMILQKLYQRVLSTTLLDQQLARLANSSRVTVHPSCTDLFPTIATLPDISNWTAITSTQEVQQLFSVKFGECSDLSLRFFTVQFKTKQGSFCATVMISPAYPEVAPQWVLQQAASPFDQDFKDIQVELNAHYDELVSDSTASWNWLLSHQIKRLQMCLGSLAESKSRSFEPNESRSRRGRNRRHPLAFDASEAQFFHR